jgi:hypothetical protein
MARVRLFGGIAIAALAIGVFVVVYHGPGRGVLRGHVGDVAATMLVYAVLGVLLGAWTRPWLRGSATLAIATAIELAQLGWRGDGAAAELVVGSTFDAWDLVAYVAGVAIAMAWEQLASRRA